MQIFEWKPDDLAFVFKVLRAKAGGNRVINSNAWFPSFIFRLQEEWKSCFFVSLRTGFLKYIDARNKNTPICSLAARQKSTSNGALQARNKPSAQFSMFFLGGMLLFDSARQIYISSEKLRDNHRIVARSVRKLITARSLLEVF